MSQKAKEFETEILKRGYDFHTRTRFDRRGEEYIISKDGLHYVSFGEDIVVSTVSNERLLAETEKQMKVLINKNKKESEA